MLGFVLRRLSARLGNPSAADDQIAIVEHHGLFQA